MGYFESMYKSNKNIIDDYKFLETAFKEDNFSFTNIPNGDNTQIENKELENFYIVMTQLWEKNVMNVPQSYPYYKTNKYDVMQAIVKQVGYVKTIEDVKTVADLLIKYNVNKHMFWGISQSISGTGNFSLDIASDFIHVESNSYHTMDHKSLSDITSRFYINCENKDILKVLKQYITYCERTKIPYYFKFTPDISGRNDKIVIYTSNKYLKQNIKILDQIAKDYPEVVSKCGELSAALVRPNKLYGFGNEPDEKYLKTKESFHSIREKILDDNKEIIINEMINDIINSKNVDKYKNILMKGIREYSEDRWRKDYNDRKERIARELKEGKTHPVSADVLEVASTFDKEKYFNYIDSHLNDIMSSALQGNRYVIKPDEFTNYKGNNKNAPGIFMDNCLTFYSGDVLKAFGRVATEIKPNVIGEYQSNIKKDCLKYGIDPNNFSFNLSTLEEFRKMDQEDSLANKQTTNNNTNENNVTNVQTTNNTNIPTPSKENNTNDLTVNTTNTNVTNTSSTDNVTNTTSTAIIDNSRKNIDIDYICNNINKVKASDIVLSFGVNSRVARNIISEVKRTGKISDEYLSLMTNNKSKRR